MNKHYFISLYDYTFWANRQVWNCAMNLDAAKWDEDLNYSIGSVHSQLFHIMEVENWWPIFLAENRLEFLAEKDYPTRDSIRAKWDEVEAFLRAYLDRLNTTELERFVKPDVWDETDAPIQVWQALLQVANHSTDHRAQTLAGLHRLGAPTLGQDYLGYWEFTHK